jgi:uncharacterized damage-inducible protein DinB
MNSMNKSALLVLHDYNDYANQLLLGTAAKMTAEELTRKSSPSHDSVKGLILHFTVCEYSFILRCIGTPLESITEDFDNFTLDQLRSFFAKVSALRKEYLESVSEESLNEVLPLTIRGVPLSLPRWQMLAQSLLQSIHHRGELSIVMTSLGYPLPTLDPIIQFINQSGQVWCWE